MADPKDIQLLEQTRNAAGRLAKVSQWPSTDEPFSARDDFIYELYCLTRFLLDLSRNYEIVYQPGTGKKKHAFPKSPAKKKGRPKYILYPSGAGEPLWQLCTGTGINDKFGVERHPDLSLQVASASDSPSHEEVSAIWEAKYRDGPEKRIGSDEVHQFAAWVETLGLKDVDFPDLLLEELGELAGHTLICNGLPSTEPDQYLRHRNVRECTAFYPKETHAVRPEEPAASEEEMRALPGK